MPERLNLDPLREHFDTKPRTKYAQVRRAWPDIQRLRDEGQRLKDIWEWACQCGIEITYTCFIGCVRRLAKDARPFKTPTPIRPIVATGTPDPLQSIREGRPKAFYDPAPKEDLLR